MNTSSRNKNTKGGLREVQARWRQFQNLSMYQRAVSIVVLTLASVSSNAQMDSVHFTGLELITSSSFTGFRKIDKAEPFTGVMFEHYPGTKTVEWSQTVRNGSTSGSVVKHYYPSGKIQSITNYGDAGYEHGEYQEWYESGNLKVEGEHSMGNNTGRWTYYNEDGTVKERIRHRRNCH